MSEPHGIGDLALAHLDDAYLDDAHLDDVAADRERRPRGPR